MNDDDLINAIIVNAREFFPNGSVHVHWDNSEDRWVLLVTDEALTHRFTAATVGDLLKKSENFLEHEDEYAGWEEKQCHHEK